MNVTLISLEALILKATHESLSTPDPAAVEAFYVVMHDANDGSQLAAQALAARTHSNNTNEALLALTMLDRCMRRGDTNFHAEVGKFRFLNEIIKLVSPKYLADKTSPEVQTRIIQLLHAWSIEYPRESKFKVAYDMLKTQGVVKETPPPLPTEGQEPPAPRARNAIFEDEEKSKLLQKLLQSKKPEDLQHANRLIKTMVREEERRNEASSRRAQEVGSALDSAGLLLDMLEHAANASQDEEQLIHELHARCTRFRPVLQRLAAAEPAQNCALDDILQATDLLDEVFDKYNIFLSQCHNKHREYKNVSNNDSLLDFAGGNTNTNIATPKNNVIDHLGEIFSTHNASSTAETLKPVNLMSNEVDTSENKTVKTSWSELDSLGDQLLLLKLKHPENTRHVDGFNSKPAKKIPMNALEKVAPVPQETLNAVVNNSGLLDLDFFTKLEEQPKVVKNIPAVPTTTNDDLMVDINIENSADVIKMPTNTAILDLKPECDTTTAENNNEAKPVIITKDPTPLADLRVTLASVKPSKLPPVTAFDDNGDITVVLHFCKDKPRDDVNVIVVSTTSKSAAPIEDYKFQAVVPKGCKVRLLDPSGSSLPAYNPFLPPPALTQVMLVSRPSSAISVNLKFIITYNCDNDTYSEMGEVKDLPLNNVT